MSLRVMVSENVERLIKRTPNSIETVRNACSLLREQIESEGTDYLARGFVGAKDEILNVVTVRDGETGELEQYALFRSDIGEQNQQRLMNGEEISAAELREFAREVPALTGCL
ncbi:MAG: hypothetical protein ACF8MJ_03270 [Phycisphaerales bacterium JB050]